MKELRGRNAVLTGASRGLGIWIGRALAAEGVNLALAARSADELDVQTTHQYPHIKHTEVDRWLLAPLTTRSSCDKKKEPSFFIGDTHT